MTRGMRRICVCAWLVLVFAGTACAGQGYRVVTSFYPVYIMALNVASGVPGVEVDLLAPAVTGCLHEYSLTPVEMKALARADLFVVNGAGMEGFLSRVASSYPGLEVVELSQGQRLLLNADGKAGNPHVWLSVTRAMEEVRALAAALAAHDPQHAGQYRENAQRYLDKLEALRLRMHAALDPFKGREIITFHEAFPYFAEEFGLKIAAVVEREPGSAPSAQELARTIDLARRAGIKALFSEPQYPAAAAEAIARETASRVYVLDPAVTGPKDPDAYLKIMDENARVLEQALAQ